MHCEVNMKVVSVMNDLKHFLEVKKITHKDILTIREKYRRTDYPIEDIAAEFGLSAKEFEIIQENYFPKTRRNSEIETDRQIWIRDFLNENWHWKDAEKCRENIALKELEKLKQLEKETQKEEWCKSDKAEWLKENWHFRVTKRKKKSCRNQAICSSGRTFFVPPKKKKKYKEKIAL